MVTGDHIVKSFDQELGELDTKLSQMGGLVEAELHDSLIAFSKRDSRLAERVIATDVRVDQLFEDVEQTVVKMLALRQPMASDLRRIVASLRLSADLERIGDYAANVAKRTIALNQVQTVRAQGGIPALGRLVQHLLKDVLDALADNDADKALDVRARDEHVDELYNSVFRELLTYMMEDPRNITAATHILFIAKNLERIGDHATNIAETLYFVITGTQLRDARPKSDVTSLTLVDHDSGASTVAGQSNG